MRQTSDRYTLRDQFKDFILDKAELKKDFEEYITAPQFSLDLRWQMFLDAPADLSNHEDYIYHGLDFVNNGKPYGNTWIRNSENNWERGYKIDLVDNIGEFLKLKCMADWPCMKDPDIMNKVKEQVLKDNIKSFTYDW